MPEFELATFDLVVIGLYVVGILGIGYWASRQAGDSDDFFLAGRGMTWPLVGFSLIVTNFSGTQFLGLAGAGYDTGIAVWNYEWMATLVLVFFAVLILPVYIQSKITTVPEFLGRRYDQRSRYAFSGFTVLTAMLIDSAGGLFAGALVLSLIYPDVPMMVHVVIIAVLGGIYVILGGLRAVMITDTIQGVLLFLAAAIIFVIVFAQFEFNWMTIPEMAPEDGFSIVRPPDDEFLPWPGIFTGVIWLGFYVWISNHVVVQRVLAAKNLDHGRWGALFAGLMQLPLLVLLIFPGILARGIFEDLENPDYAWPALIFEYMPIGIRGLVVAALIAALMSTLDSVLNGAAHLVVNDFVKTRDKEWSDKALLRLSRVLVFVFMVIAIAWAPMLLQFDTLVEYFQSFLGYVTMPIVVVLVGGLFWRRGTADGAFWTLVTVVPLGLVGFLTGEILELHPVQFLYATGIMLLISLAFFVVISLRTEAPDPEDIQDVVFDKRNWRKESEELKGKAWYANYRILALALVVLTVGVVIPFI